MGCNASPYNLGHISYRCKSISSLRSDKVDKRLKVLGERLTVQKPWLLGQVKVQGTLSRIWDLEDLIKGMQ